MRWAEYVASMEDRRGTYRVVVGRGNLREKDHLQDPGVNSKIKLRWIFRRLVGEVWTGLIWFRIRKGGELL
jgi:hypothetical protein